MIMDLETKIQNKLIKCKLLLIYHNNSMESTFLRKGYNKTKSNNINHQKDLPKMTLGSFNDLQKDFKGKINN